MRMRRLGPGESLAAGLVELGRLAGGAGRIWWTHFLTMGAWFCGGFILHTVGVAVSAQLGARHATLSTMAFVLGVAATLVALVLMIHSVEPGLRTVTRVDPGAAEPRGLRVPDLVFVRESRSEVVAAAVGPFLAVYAVWGFVNDQVKELFTSNYTVQGLGGIENFSISFGVDRLRFYLVLAAATWVLRQLVGAVTSRRRILPLALVGVFLEALWVFSFFALLIILTRSVVPWVRTRAGYVALQEAWRAGLDWLPDWTLPFGLSLPQALDRGVELVVGTVLPGAWHGLVLPLVWLALTATVLGWREFRGSEVLAGTRLGARLAGWSRPGAGPVRTLADLATSDLRTKYLPVLAALRLVARAGPRFIGVYLLLATLLGAAQQLFDIAGTVLLGPRSVAASLLTDPVTTLLSDLLFTTLSIALYAAAFDEALAVAMGPDPAREPQLSGGTPPPDRRPAYRHRPTSAATAPGRRTLPG